MDLPTFQNQVRDFRRRAYPGETEEDVIVRLVAPLEAWDRLTRPEQDALIGDLLCDLCLLAGGRQLDLMHHGQRAFRAMQREYGGQNGH